MASNRDIRQILSPARFNALPADTQSVLNHAWNTHTAGLKSELEKTRVDSEQKISALQKRNQQLETEVAEFKEEKDKGLTSLDLYREQATSSAATAAKLTEEISKLSAERDDFRRQFYNSKAERDDMAGLADRRQEEVERLHSKIKDLTSEYNQAVNTRCEAQARLEDLQSKEINIEFREKRLSEERNFLESQIENLKEEITKRNEEVLAAKREAGLRQIELGSEVADKTEQIRILNQEKQSAQEEKETYRRKVEMLTERLKEARDSESKLEDNYRAELKSQKKLAELYKEQSDENTQKTEELSNAVTNLQDMLKDAGVKYGDLEHHIEKVKADYKVEIDKGNDTIKALKTELENANKLINTVKNKGLTEDAIEHLSPSAAQASRLLKSGVTLTGIYSQMVTISEELALEKEENKRLNEYMDQILVEIEERAPILKQQREDYEHAMSAVGGLTESLEAAREEVELRRREAEEARRDLNSVEKDRNKLEQQVMDLGKQMTVLVREVEAARAGGQVYEPPQTVDVSSLESVIEARLLTYKDVTELQQRNIELLAVVRQLSESREQAESSLIDEKTAEIRQELDTALRQAEELRAARERQQKMVDNLIKQRDLYKSMAVGKDPGTSAAALASSKETPLSDEATRKIEKLTEELEETKKELTEYKKEKGENYKMLEKDYSKLRDQLLEARSQAAKLASQEEYNTQKFNIAKSNCESLKKQIDALEVRNRQLDGIVEKHELSITSLREELLVQNRKLSHAELQTDQLKQENSHLKSVEARLMAEREVLHREKSSTNQILANLQQIQINLERKDDQQRIQLSEANGNLTKEIEMLRKKLDEEQEHFKVSVRNWESSNQELREKMAREEQLSKSSVQRLNEVTSTMEALKAELKEKADELQLAESRLAGRGQLSSQANLTETEWKNKYRDGEILLGKSKQEIKLLKVNLAGEKKKVEELTQMTETAEKRMMESSKAMTDCKQEADQKVKYAEEGKMAAEKIAQDYQNKMKEMEKKISDLEVEVGAEGGELRERFQQAGKQLDDAKERIQQLEFQDKEIRQKMEELSSEAKEVQEKYQRELLLHAKDIEALNELKAETKSKMSSLEEADLDRSKVESRIAELKESHAKDMKKKSDEIAAIQEQLESVCKQNECLVNQLQSVTGQLADLSASAQTLDTSQAADTLNASNISNRSLEGEDASNEQLMSILKYLRKEKEIVSGRLEVKEAELARISRQLEHAQKQTQDIQNALEMERQEKNENLMTAGKHAELLRKVESLAALTDSNKLLREEKDKLSAAVHAARKEAEDANQKLAPLENKIKDLEDRYGTLLVEKNSLQTQTDEWKKRSDNLVEKSFKMNPEELKRLQDTETKLGKQVAQLTNEKQKALQQISTLTKDLNNNKQTIATLKEELKGAQEEVKKKQEDSNALNAQKNKLANMNRMNNDLKKKLAETEKKLKDDTIKLKQDLEASESKAKQAGEEEVTSLKQKIEQIDAEKVKLNSDLTAQKEMTRKLRLVGKQMKEKKILLEKEVNEKNETLANLKNLYEGQTKELETTKAELENANSMVTDMDPEKYVTLLGEKEKLEDDIKLKSEQLEKSKKLILSLRSKVSSKSVSKSDPEFINLTNEHAALTEEHNKLKEEMEKATTEKDKMKSALESRMSKLTNENIVLKAELEEKRESYEKLSEQVESLQAQLDSAAAASASKPVAVAGVVHQQEPRKSAQPQAHIQPHRHQPPRDEFRPTQTASIRPMTQRTAAAVVLPTSQVGSSVQQESASVPVVSVSPSVSSAAPQLPSTSQLDPMASEFVPGDRSTPAATSSEPMVAVMEDEPLESSRPDSVQASTSSPAPPTHTAQTSTSGTTQTTASVQPTLKRQREMDTSTEETPVAGPSGVQKKAKTEHQEAVEHETEINIADTEEDSQDALGESEMIQDADLEASEENIGSSAAAEEAKEVQLDDEAEFENDDLEEGEVSEDEEDEIAEPDLGGEETEDLNDDEEGEDQEEINPNVAHGLFSAEPLEEDGENSSNIPSSSTGAVAAGSTPSRSTFAAGNIAGPSSGFDVESGEDSVVSGIPKLSEPRVSQDAFSEAVSSPQVPSAFDFTVGASGSSSSAAVPESEVSTGSGQEEATDRAAYEVSQLARPEGLERPSVSPVAVSPQPPILEDVEAAQPEEEALSEAVEIESGSSEATAVASVSREQPEESGVSSSGTAVESSTRGRSRTRITWESPPSSAASSRQTSGPASTSPQRTLNRSAIGGSSQVFSRTLRGALRGRGGAKRGGN